ncbi:MAG: hypothetical protein OEV94_01580 [Deltaproteobacteria bacterium]|nr:hypothetical protein [Deltaproteobacteria bacterium]
MAPAGWRLALWAVVLASGWAGAFPAQAQTLNTPLITAPIQDPAGKPLGEARVYFNFVELAGTDGRLRGAVGVVVETGRSRLYLVNRDDDRAFIGWAVDHRLYNPANELVGYYYYTPTWSYVYDTSMKKKGQARCLAYQGVCAAGVAGYLLGLMEAPPAKPEEPGAATAKPGALSSGPTPTSP